MRSLLFSLSAAYLLQFAAAQCFFANGTQLPDTPEYSEYKPCSTGGPATICCGINRENPAGGNATIGRTADECLPNGLCQNRQTKSGVQSTQYFIDFCADGNIDSGKCMNMCAQTRSIFGITAMTPCTGRADSDRWCCGGSNACCQSNVGVVNLAQVMGGAMSISSAAPSSTDAPSSTAARSSSILTTSASSSRSASSSSSSPIPSAPAKAVTSSSEPALSPGAIAGIVIGALAFLVLLAAVIFFALRARKYKKRAGATELHEFSAANAPSYPPHYGSDGGYGSEKYAGYGAREAPLVELAQPSARASRTELPGATTYAKDTKEILG